ncbi:MAG: siderophore-interacting protein [Rhodobacteraceae bacterium]|nr:siderophore-interacting protein [Paracoccaceae bacterium]
MTLSPDPQSFSMDALITCVDGPATFAALRARSLEYGEVQEDRPGRFACTTSVGLVDLRQDERGLVLGVRARDAGTLQMMRDTVFYLTEELEGVSGVAWAGEEAGCATDTPALPANFRLVTVTGAWRTNRDFIRLRVSGETLAPFAETGMHFRLAIPAPGRTPVWPCVSPEGRTRWPEGEDKLHTPAYTIVAVSPEEGWIEFDVYTHGRGPTCAWAEGLLAGTEPRSLVGLSGPGGGWFPDTDDLLIGGDETALPAILRILTHHEGRARAVIELADEAAKEAIPEDIRPLVEVLCRDAGGSAADWLEARVDQHGTPGFLWFAGETTAAQRLRARMREDWKLPRGAHYLSAYWTDTSTA